MADNSRAIYLDRVESQVFLTNDVSANDPTCDADPCKALRQKIEDRDDVRSVRFLNRDDAYNDAIKKFPQYKDVAGKDAFPGVVHRQAGQSRAAQGLRRCDRRPAGRAERAEPEGPDRPAVRGARRAVSNAAFAVALVQAVGAILLIANMVQVAAYTRRTEIGIMRLVGASRWYTQLPFLVEAMLAAFIGVVIAIVGLIVVRALFLENALNQFYQANLIAKVDYADILYIARRCMLFARRRDGRRHLVRHLAPLRPTIAVAKKADPTRSSNNRVVATNRKARHNYSILETFEAGVALMGTEVKSLRDGQASLADAFATVDDGEIWLRNLHIPEYHHGSWTNHAPRRNRKLLLHRKQIDTLVGKIRDGNLTLVPLSLYFSDGKVKVELALARGKQAHDKRQDMARRDAQREVTRELGRRAKGMT